jgi:hypothetical protein
MGVTAVRREVSGAQTIIKYRLPSVVSVASRFTAPPASFVVFAYAYLCKANCAIQKPRWNLIRHSLDVIHVEKYLIKSSERYQFFLRLTVHEGKHYKFGL